MRAQKQSYATFSNRGFGKANSLFGENILNFVDCSEIGLAKLRYVIMRLFYWFFSSVNYIAVTSKTSFVYYVLIKCSFMSHVYFQHSIADFSHSGPQIHQSALGLNETAELSDRNMYFHELLCIIVVDLVVLNT